MLTAYKKGQAVQSEEALLEKHMNRIGDVKGLHKLSSRGKRFASATSSGNKLSQFHVS